jgi:hypothetical protein
MYVIQADSMLCSGPEHLLCCEVYASGNDELGIIGKEANKPTFSWKNKIALRVIFSRIGRRVV